MLFCRAEWAWEGWLASRVSGVDLGKILRSTCRFSAISCTIRRRWCGEAPTSRAGGASFYGEDPQTICTRKSSGGGRDGNGQLEDYDGGKGL